MAAVEAGRHGDELLCVHAAQAFTQLGGSGVHDGVELVGGLGAGLDGAAPGDSQQPDRLHRRRSVTSGSRLASPASTARAAADGVGRVGLAVAAAMLAVRAGHLDHHHAQRR